ncbi:ATP cone domain-containing protein [Marinoscillum luteum]|uniref:ATP cone domain-containing protein n=1 Tax=Marinoscillum luteum TaxID=861051 RepID=A0ABW7NEA4_9BACT
MESSSVQIVKYSGETTPFDIDKLRQSLLDAGATESATARISRKIADELYDGISTKQIYQRAHRLLRNHAQSKASRYGLKKAILNMGPTGYPFELFVGELMKAQGFKVKVGTVMPGKCVTHEVDVYAENEKMVRMMECKFHNRLGYKTDVKVTMYIKSRFEDLEAVWKNDAQISHKKHEGWVVTNARFTKDAIDFGTCSRLQLLSWDYPAQGSLKSLVTRHRLYPITTIGALSKSNKELLMKKGIVLAKTLWEQPEALEGLGLESSKIDKILTEAQTICDL